MDQYEIKYVCMEDRQKGDIHLYAEWENETNRRTVKVFYVGKQRISSKMCDVRKHFKGTLNGSFVDDACRQAKTIVDGVYIRKVK